MAHIARSSGTILTASIYNADHVAHDTDLTLLNLSISGFANIGRVRGFFAESTNGTALQMAADSIVLQRAPGGLPIWNASPTYLACSLITSGPIANGRDRAASYSSGNWIYFFFIWNGATLATLNSPSRTSPILPAGYTHWCYATAVRAVGTNLMNEVYARGAWVYYMTNDPPITRVLSAGQATSFTSVSLASWIPSFSRMVQTNWTLNLVHNLNSITFLAYYRNGTVQPNGRVMAAGTTIPGPASAIAINTVELPTQTDQNIQYRLSQVPGVSGGVSIDVLGYLTDNGDT